MFNFFKRKYGTGALEDERRPSEKSFDFYNDGEEIKLPQTTPVIWKEKKPEEWNKYPIFNQKSSGSCVAMTAAKMLGIINQKEEKRFVILSARDIYTRRTNIGMGMNFWEACQIAKNTGATLDYLMPGQNQDEATINNRKDFTNSLEVIGKVYRINNYFALPFSFDRIVSTIANGSPVMLGHRWDLNEWDLPVPRMLSGSQRREHHSTTGVDYTLWQGKRAIVVDDSWGRNRGINGQRVMTEDWFNPSNGRITAAWHFENLSNLDLLNNTIEKPKFIFTRNMAVNDRNTDVAMLQRCLGYLQDAVGWLFPLTQSPTGFYGGITASGVRRYQRLRQITVTSMVDNTTRESLNKDFR